MPAEVPLVAVPLVEVSLAGAAAAASSSGAGEEPETNKVEEKPNWALSLASSRLWKHGQH